MPNTTEQHFHLKELADIWGVSVATLRRLFEQEEGVLKIGQPSRRVGRALKRSYFTMRIPKSVADRVHQKLGKRQ